MIRELHVKDKDIFLSMVKEFYSSEAVLHTIPPGNILNTYNEIISDSPYVKAYVIEEKAEIAGYTLLSLTYSNEAGGLVVLVEELYTREQFRGLGLGNRMLDFIHTKFSGTAKRFRLEIVKTNHAAERLYLRKGYVPLEYLQMVCDRS